MGNNAWERAVEAGARSDAAFDGRSWEALSRAERERYLARARKSQGAAFPILAEELVAWHDEQALIAQADAEKSVDEEIRQDCLTQAATSRYDAAALRARIQQMAEAL